MGKIKNNQAWLKRLEEEMNDNEILVNALVVLVCVILLVMIALCCLIF